MLKKGARKGQVTVFVIIAILVIGVISFFIITRDQVDQEFIPEEHQPVSSFISACLYHTAEQGLRIIGEHGGYIEEEKTSSNPTEEKAVDFTGTTVVYWHYMDSSNDCKDCSFNSEMPFLKKKDGSQSIEEELDNYIKNKLPECLDNFESINSQGFTIEELGEVIPDTQVDDESVIVNLNYAIRSTKETEKVMSKYTAELPVNLKRVYGIAQNITEQSAKEKFLEHLTLNLISAFSGTNVEDLPSISETRFDTKQTVWIEQEVGERVKTMLSTYIQGILVENSDNYITRPAIQNAFTQRLYDNMIIPSSRVGNPSGMRVEFDYLEWPLYFYMGCDGACKPESLTSNFGFPFSLQRYNFVYDISYPAVVTIEDINAFNGDGYTFRFALESNIRNNKALEGDNLALKSIPSDTSQLCQPSQRTSGNVTIKTLNANNAPIENAIISYKCGSETCTMGTTDEKGEYNSQFPVCINGIVTAIKQEHLGKKETITTLIDNDNEVSLVLPSLVKKNVSGFKKNLQKTTQGWIFNNQKTPLQSNEQLTISFRKLAQENEEEYETAILLEGSKEEEVLLAPGNYEVSGTLILKDQVSIPSEERCVCTKPIICDEQCFTTPPVEYSSDFPEGGFYLDQSTGVWTVFPESLQENNEIEIITIAADITSVPVSDRKIEDMQVFASMQDYSASNRRSIEPEFKKTS